MQSESIDDRNHDAVTVTTIHKAKGLEWEAVFIPRFVAGVLPINFAQTPAALDEELRLAYVGVTRAKRHLALSWSSSYEAFNKVRTQGASGFLALLQDSPQLRQRTVEVSYLLGGKVADDRFGLGTITKIEGTYLTIDFGSGGLRRIPKLDPKLDLL